MKREIKDTLYFMLFCFVLITGIIVLFLLFYENGFLYNDKNIEYFNAFLLSIIEVVWMFSCAGIFYKLISKEEKE